MDVGATLLLPGGASSFLTVHNFPGIRHRIVTRHLQPCHGSLRSFTMVTAARTFGPSHFINREMSWLEFNQRVLDEALDSATPLLERVKFFCISSSNLDEFFEIRVAGDRKSTRLNSSHGYISYAVFCLKTTISRPAFIHNANRPLPCNDSYKTTILGI